MTVIAIDLPRARGLALQVVLGQAAVTLIAALLSWSMADGRAAGSALLGGGIGTAASLVMVLLSFRGTAGSDPQRMLRAFFVGEAAKVAVVVVAFVVVLKTVKVVPMAMLGAYIATFGVFWMALAGVFPPLRSRSHRADPRR